MSRPILRWRNDKPCCLMLSSDEFPYTANNPDLVASKKTPIIAEMQERVDNIQTEAARLVVFANTTTDLVLASRLKGIAKAVFKNAAEIERQLVQLRKAQ